MGHMKLIEYQKYFDKLLKGQYRKRFGKSFKILSKSYYCRPSNFHENEAMKNKRV